MDTKELASKVKKMGLKVYKRAKKEFNDFKTAAEQNLFADKLRSRFNLENPYKFIIIKKGEKLTFMDKYLPKHAKRYNEDDIFVFYGETKDTGIAAGDRVRDLSDETMYEVVQTVDVTIPVNYEDKVYDVPCTAVYGKIVS